jgi:RHS repeat-associated protein
MLSTYLSTKAEACATNDRLTTRTDQLGRTDTYTYDAAGQVLTHTDRRGNLTEYRYDDLGRTNFVGYGRTGTAPNYSYASTVVTTYDGNSHVLSQTDSAAPGTGTISYTYNDLGQLATRTDGSGTITYTYDTAGRPDTTAISGQPTITYSYDSGGRLSTITQGSRTFTYTYDNGNRVHTLTQPGGLTTTTDYDANGNIAALTYTRTVGATTTTLGSITYTYDSLNQLTGAHGPWARLTLPADQSTTTYDEANHPASINGRAQTYDNDGNRTRDGPTVYTWNSRNQLTAVGTSAFGYSADGQLASIAGPTGTTTYRYSGTDLIAETTPTTAASYLPNPFGDGALTRTTPSSTSSYLTDSQGSTLALADGTGNLTGNYTYDPFGGSTATDDNPIRYTGRPSAPDLPNSLQYNRARFYDTSQGRFVSEDPAGPTSADANLYNYGLADPVDHTDPSGLIPGGVIGCLAGVLVRDLVGGLAGRKHTIGDYTRGALYGCMEGAVLGAPFGASADARLYLASAKERAALASAKDSASRIPVIHRWPDGKVALGWPGHEVFNVPLSEWTAELNAAWIQSIIDRRLSVYVGSNPLLRRNLVKVDPLTGQEVPTTFAIELWQLAKAGYRFGDGWMLHPPPLP